MLTKNDINRILKIKENYELPEVLLSAMLNCKERELVFEQFIKIEQDLSFDWFTDYFQNEHGDRDSLKQDYTPQCISKIVTGLMENHCDVIADICAGSGTLVVKAWNENKDAKIYAEELSSRVLPILIFNLSIRNMNAIVFHGDTLTRESEAVYKITKGTRFSEIEKVNDFSLDEIRECADAVIMNPPYSLKWGQVEDERFKAFGIAPKTKADYAFLLHGLYTLKTHGTLIAILPHGVLFRGASEGVIRENLIRENYLDAVIGLPDKLFLHTGIPVCVLVLKKQRTENNILFIDASKDFSKGSPQNIMEESHIGRILKVYKERCEVEKYSHIASFKEIEDNGFNLNIPRYVDTFEREPVPDIVDTLQELIEINGEIRKTEAAILKMMRSIEGTSKEAQEQHEKAVKLYTKYVNGGRGEVEQMEMDIW